MTNPTNPDLPLLQGLGYLGVASDKLEDWTSFARDFVGMQLADSSRDTRILRMDDRHQRLVVTDAADTGWFGWQVADAAGLAEVAGRLDTAQVAQTAMTSSELALRGIADGFWFRDPEGNRVEIFHTPAAGDGDFQPGRNITGFRLGSLGMGHAVLLTANPQPMITFYRDVLGFRLSDWTSTPFEAYFFHTNPRHHSLAIVVSKNKGIHHVMVELNNLDDVGQGYDIAQRRPEGIGVTLGRHSNDHMTSFYARTPSGFMLEYGWGGLCLDPLTWAAEEIEIGPSLWGHDRDWLPPDLQQLAVKLRMDAARDGYRAPVHVQPGNHEVNDLAANWPPKN